MEKIRDDLNGMVGLSRVKQDLEELILDAEIIAEHGIDAFPGRSMSMVLTGNPGTGKTEVAKKLAELYARLGLTGARFKAVSAKQLIKPYEGQTEAALQEELDKIAANGGGVLVIDEAHQLAKTEFGRNAIDVLIPWMEDNRHNSAVVLAGYPQQMKDLFALDPGLERRFTNRLQMPDYNAKERVELAQYFADKDGFDIKVPSAALKRIVGPTDPQKNAGGVRELLGVAMQNAVRRIHAEGKDPTDPANRVVTESDFA